MKRCTYLLPIRRAAFSAAEAAELAEYFQDLNTAGCDVLVIDGSPSLVFQQHAQIWRSL
jgi:predicted ATPase